MNDYLARMTIYQCVFLLLILMFILNLPSCLISEYLSGIKICLCGFFPTLVLCALKNFSVKLGLKLQAEVRRFNKFQF